MTQLHALVDRWRTRAAAYDQGRAGADGKLFDVAASRYRECADDLDALIHTDPPTSKQGRKTVSS